MISQEVKNRSLCLGESLIVLWWPDWHCIRCDVSLGSFKERAKSLSQMAEEDMEPGRNASSFIKKSNTTSECSMSKFRRYR